MDNQKKCLKCGFVNNASSNFCVNCGNTFNKNKYCLNCGILVNNSEISCPNCGKNLNYSINNQVNEINNQVDKVDNDDNNEQANMMGGISLLLYFLGSTVLTAISYVLPENLQIIASSFSALCPLAGIVLMIIGRVNYPNNKFLKKVMWIIIITIILAIIAFILFTIWCYFTCKDATARGCG